MGLFKDLIFKKEKTDLLHITIRIKYHRISRNYFKLSTVFIFKIPNLHKK